MVRAVLFDFYGTLARAVAWGPSFDEVLGGYGLALSAAAREAWSDEVFDGQEHAAPSKSSGAYRRWELNRLARLARRCGASPHRCQQVARDLHAAAKAFTLAAYPEVPEVLAELRRRRLALGVCSNWDWNLDAAMSDVGLHGAVDAAVTSAQAGARKPHPRIYSVALDRLGVPPDAVLFAGDTWYPDVEGPRSLGMRAVHLWRDPPTSTHAPPLPSGVYRGPDLTAVLDALAGTTAA